MIVVARHKLAAPSAWCARGCTVALLLCALFCNAQNIDVLTCPAASADATCSNSQYGGVFIAGGYLNNSAWVYAGTSPYGCAGVYYGAGAYAPASSLGAGSCVYGQSNAASGSIAESVPASSVPFAGGTAAGGAASTSSVPYQLFQSLSPGDAAAIAGSVGGLWALAWVIREIARMIGRA